MPYYRASFNVGATALFPFGLFPPIVLRTAMTTLTAETKISPLWAQGHSQGRSWVTCAVVLISIISLIVLSAFQEGNKWVNSPFVMFHHSRSQFAERISTCLDCQSFSSVSESDRMQSSPRQWARLQSDERPNSRTANKPQQSTFSKLNLHLQILLLYDVFRELPTDRGMYVQISKRFMNVLRIARFMNCMLRCNFCYKILKYN